MHLVVSLVMPLSFSLGGSGKKLVQCICSEVRLRFYAFNFWWWKRSPGECLGLSVARILKLVLRPGAQNNLTLLVYYFILHLYISFDNLNIASRGVPPHFKCPSRQDCKNNISSHWYWTRILCAFNIGLVAYVRKTWESDSYWDFQAVVNWTVGKYEHGWVVVQLCCRGLVK